MSDTPEFSRPFDLRGITVKPVKLSAGEAECAALAKRFDIVAIASLEAEVSLEAEASDVRAKGTLDAVIVQSCAVSGEDLPVTIREAINLRFVPAERLEVSQPDAEVELEAGELDEIGYTGTSIDLGEAVAQTLALAIDPYAEGPNADAFRREQGLLAAGAEGSLADALRALREN
jgi:hypothetical protein